MNIRQNFKLKKRNKTEWLLGLLLVASPWILLFFTTTILAKHSVLNSTPCWSDELTYWHEVLSLSQKGLNFGYYTMNEALPKYLSFGTHGFGTVSVYALFAKVFGWKIYSIVIANAFFMSLAFLTLNTVTKIPAKRLLYILIFGLTYLPLVLFSSTSMTELLNFSIKIIYFGLLYVYFKRGGSVLLVFLLVFCMAISFVRIINIVLFLPLLFKRENEFKFDLRFFVQFLIWFLFSGLLFFVNNLFVSPYPDSFLVDLFASKGFGDFMSNFATHFVQNTWNLINPFSENIIQVFERYFIIFICVVSLLKSKLIQTGFKRVEIDYFIVFLILFLFLVINVAAYDVFDWRDYRVMAPVLFGCILFLILNGKAFITYNVLIINLLGLILMLISPQVLESFSKDRYLIPAENKLLNKIEYTQNPKSGFENTIAVQQFNTKTVLNIPAGIGISYSDTISDKLRSRYIFTDKKIRLKTYNLISSDRIGFLYMRNSVE
ncbi:MAG: hypothetical protein P4L34_03195 [Paludibacter sp.]|nr:hypothetical protein [Paludibacter sp.]